MKTLAPIPPPQSKSALIKAFHNEVVTALKKISPDGQVRMQPVVSDAIKVGSLLGWHQYLSCLNASGVSSEQLGALCQSYTLVGGTSPLFSVQSEQGRHARPYPPQPETAPPAPARRRRPGPPMGPTGAGLPRRPAPPPAPNGPPRHRPTYSTADWELDAAAGGVLAFMKVLRLVQSHSGLNANQLARITKIPVSSTYRMFDEATKTLPRKAQHITALLYACGLPTAQIDRVMAIWRTLRFDQQALKAATSAPAAVAATPVETAAPADLEEPRERAPERPKPPPRPTRPARPARSARSARPARPTAAQVTEARELLRTRAEVSEKPVYLTKRRGAVTRHARRARRARRALMLKVLMSSMISALLVTGVLFPVPMDSARSMGQPRYDLGVTNLPREVPSLVPATAPMLVRRPGRPQAYY